MGRPTRLTLGSVTTSAVFTPDLDRDPFNIGIGVAVAAGSTLTYSVEYTFDDVAANNFNPATATWTALSTLSGKTATADGNIAYPVTGVRLNMTAWTAGSATVTFIQAGRAQGV